MLDVSNLSAGYGSTQVLHNVSLHVAAGQSVLPDSAPTGPARRR